TGSQGRPAMALFPVIERSGESVLRWPEIAEQSPGVAQLGADLGLEVVRSAAQRTALGKLPGDSVGQASADERDLGILVALFPRELEPRPRSLPAEVGAI